APSGRVRMKANQNWATRDRAVQMRRCWLQRVKCPQPGDVCRAEADRLAQVAVDPAPLGLHLGKGKVEIGGAVGSLERLRLARAGIVLEPREHRRSRTAPDLL